MYLHVTIVGGLFGLQMKTPALFAFLLDRRTQQHMMIIVNVIPDPIADTIPPITPPL